MQVRQVITRLIAAGDWRQGDPDMLIVFDAGYDVTRLAWQLADLPVEVAGRLRSDRVLYFPAPPGTGGRGLPVRHGPEFVLAGPPAWPGPQVTTSTVTSTLALKPTTPPSPPRHAGHSARRPPASGAWRKMASPECSRRAWADPGLTWVRLS